MCEMLRINAIQGSGKNGYVPGYRIAGKTGTSEKNPKNNGLYIASYCGFAPADDPEIAMLVLYDEPQGDSYYGSYVAVSYTHLQLTANLAELRKTRQNLKASQRSGNTSQQ